VKRSTCSDPIDSFPHQYCQTPAKRQTKREAWILLKICALDNKTIQKWVYTHQNHERKRRRRAFLSWQSQTQRNPFLDGFSSLTTSCMWSYPTAISARGPGATLHNLLLEGDLESSIAVSISAFKSATKMLYAGSCSIKQGTLTHQAFSTNMQPETSCELCLFPLTLCLCYFKPSQQSGMQSFCNVWLVALLSSVSVPTGHSHQL